MKDFIVIFNYCKELFVLSIILTIVYVLGIFYSSALGSLMLIVKLLMPFLYFLTKKLNHHSTLYFLYNLGISNAKMLFGFFVIFNIDIWILSFLI